MLEQQKPSVPLVDVEAWLQQKLGGISELTAIAGGFWSAAYAFHSHGEDLILRLSDLGEGFEYDQAAVQFRSEGLPIPEVLEVGQALNHHYALSRRHFGRFLEEAPVEAAEQIGEAVVDLLHAMRSTPRGESVTWHEPSDVTWREWLLSGLIDHNEPPTGGWRQKLSQYPVAENVFQRCQSRIEELLPHCPERRDLVHSDML
ncbi:MAG: hypothetical protein AAF525_22420, partial [Pseudomonadota bacterium]